MSKHGKISADKERLSVLIYKKDKATLAGMAAKDRRSLSSFCAYLLEEIAAGERPVPFADRSPAQLRAEVAAMNELSKAAKPPKPGAKY